MLSKQTSLETSKRNRRSIKETKIKSSLVNTPNREFNKYVIELREI